MILSRGLKQQLRQFTIQTFANTTRVPNPFAHHHHHHGHEHEDHGHDNNNHGTKHLGNRPKVEYNTITNFLDHKNLYTYFEQGPGYMYYPGVNYNEAHSKPYDWRDDPKHNPDYLIPTKHINCPDPKTYVWPFEGRLEPFNPSEALSQNHLYDSSLLLKPENKQVGQPIHHLTAAQQDQDADVNHEFDYESEDCDFQTESFRTQHFRKRGPMWPWALIATMPFVYFWVEFLYQRYPDEDHWRITHPPPLNYPDSEDTDDTDTYQDYHSPSGRFLRDIGIIGDLWFDIKDGKKVMNQWAGCNQPLPDI
ncbi:unnamed protein product [Paramecium primaurelia]|uniref:Uncharacterized protein n=1 Tax=Paramecium primaurelia TaxID=5886 RepID=A0A8S1KTS8_PARPR|nr:unnamed protein product [Paramecium primaurelia]